jgi:3-dehydroquinate synthase
VQRLRVTLKGSVQEYDIKVGHGVLRSLGKEARGCLGRESQGTPRRALVISNRRVFDLYGEAAVASLRAARFEVAHWFMSDGERFKTLGTLEKALAFFRQTGLERNDVVVALGGGVVGDLAGFAAAVYLRGVPYIQVPTTLLAQIDSSVGGKTGVNLATGKNLVGAFHHPRAVIIDTRALETLPPRELTAGWCEMVKNGAVGSRQLFDETTTFLSQLNEKPELLKSKQLETLIASQCSFKAAIVAGDEREAIERTDHRSRRILNFGHTVGHALETVTGYRRFRHGEAVGHGMLVAGELAKLLGLLEFSELELLREGVRRCGPLPSASDLDEQAIIAATASDKKSAAGQIQWVLLERIGRPRIVSGREIKADALRASLRAVLGKHS